MQQVNDKSMQQTIAIINSMTPKERRIPKIIVGSRKKRIALGSGTQIQDVNRLLKQFEQMQKMMKKFTKPGGMQKMMRGIGGYIWNERHFSRRFKIIARITSHVELIFVQYTAFLRNNSK